MATHDTKGFRSKKLTERPAGLPEVDYEFEHQYPHIPYQHYVDVHTYRVNGWESQTDDNGAVRYSTRCRPITSRRRFITHYAQCDMGHLHPVFDGEPAKGKAPDGLTYCNLMANMWMEIDMKKAIFLFALTVSSPAFAVGMEIAEARKCGSEAWRMLHPENGDGFSYDTRDVIKGKRVGELAIHCGKQLPPGRVRDRMIERAKLYLAKHPEMKITSPH